MHTYIPYVYKNEVSIKHHIQLSTFDIFSNFVCDIFCLILDYKFQQLFKSFIFHMRHNFNFSTYPVFEDTRTPRITHIKIKIYDILYIIR